VETMELVKNKVPTYPKQMLGSGQPAGQPISQSAGRYSARFGLRSPVAVTMLVEAAHL
jgi:hypothetical protein